MDRPSSLTAQLRALSAPSVPVSRGKPSLLYSAQEAAERDLASLRTLGSAGGFRMHGGQTGDPVFGHCLMLLTELGCSPFPLPRCKCELCHRRLRTARCIRCALPALQAHAVQRSDARLRSQQPAAGCCGEARRVYCRFPATPAGSLPASGSISSARISRSPVQVSDWLHATMQPPCTCR